MASPVASTSKQPIVVHDSSQVTPLKTVAVESVSITRDAAADTSLDADRSVETMGDHSEEKLLEEDPRADLEGSPGVSNEPPERRIRCVRVEADLTHAGELSLYRVTELDSMYLAAFQEMQQTVLDCAEERRLFSDREIEALDRWMAMSYNARYLFVRLFLRKNGWFRHTQMDYSSEIGEVGPACKEMCTAAGAEPTNELSPSPQSAPPTEVIDLDADDEPGIPNELLAKVDDPPTDHTAEPRPKALLGVSTTALQFGRDESGVGLEHFAWDEGFLKEQPLDDILKLLSLDELKTLAKRMQVQKPGTTRVALIEGLKRASGNQSTLFGLLTPTNGKNKGKQPARQLGISYDSSGKKLTQRAVLLDRALAIIGPAVKLSDAIRALYARLHLIFHRSLVFNDQTLTASVLARARKRVFPTYTVERTGGLLFENRARLLEYEEALRIERKMEDCLGESAESWKQRADAPDRDWRKEGEKEGLEIFELAWPVWQRMVAEQQDKEREAGDDKIAYYRKRFHPGWPLTRVVYKGAWILGRLHKWEREAKVLKALLDQTVFRRGKRGVWYDRLALILMNHVGTEKGDDAEAERKREAQMEARQLCLDGLEDPYTHLIYHQSLQRRIKRLENALKTPSLHRHDFEATGLRAATKRTLQGEKLSEGETGKKSIWRANDGQEVSVEALCLEYYVRQGWKGFHSENGILTTIFSLLFWDVLFLPAEGAFETPYQNAPLDLSTDAFSITRAEAISERLARLEHGDALDILKIVDEQEREKMTWCVGVRWHYTREDLAEIVEALGGRALATICRVYAEEFGHRVGGVPDLCLWKPGQGGGVRFVEVKGPGDRLSETQKVWIDVLLSAGVEVELCAVIEAEEGVLQSDKADSDDDDEDEKKPVLKKRRSNNSSVSKKSKSERGRSKSKSVKPEPSRADPPDVIDIDALPDTPPRPKKRKSSTK